MMKCSQSCGGHTADANVSAAQNFLPDKRDHDGVINIVVCGVAGRDIFKSKLGDKANYARIVRLHRRVCSFVHGLKFADEGFYNYQGGVEHVNQPRCSHIGDPMAPSLSRWVAIKIRQRGRGSRLDLAALGGQAAHQRRGAADRGGDINDVAVPLLLVLQLERVPATVTGNA
jgi:hypothetical protein